MPCDCQYRDGGRCRLVAEAAGLPLEQALASEGACAKCCQTPTPETGEPNSVIASLAISWTRRHAPDRLEDIQARYDRYIEVLSVPKKHRALRLAQRYASAVLRWQSAGRPLRSDAEVDRIHQVCTCCEHYQPKADGCGVCRDCGCGLRDAQFTGLLDALTNKIRMATEHCWAGKW